MRRAVALAALGALAGCHEATPVFGGIVSPGGLAGDGAALYFIDNRDQPIENALVAYIGKLPLGGGQVVTLAEHLPQAISPPDVDFSSPLGGLKLDRGTLYWAARDGAALHLYSLPATGGTPQVIPGALGESELLLAFDVYAGDLWVSIADARSFRLRHVRLPAPAQRADVYVDTDAFDDHLVDPYLGFSELVASSGGVLFTKVVRDGTASGSTALLRRLPGDDPSIVPALLASGAAGKLAADATRFYWVSYPTEGGSRLWSLPFSGSTPLVLRDGVSLRLVAAGGGAVYAFDARRGDRTDSFTLLKMAPDGSSAKTVAVEDGRDVASLTIVDGTAYWLEKRPPRPTNGRPTQWEIRTAR